jgi:phage RecT family recombinase
MSNLVKSDETAIGTIIDDVSGKFVSTISQYKWELLPDSQLQAAKQALTKNDYIMKIACGDVSAVHDALVKSAVLGLDLTEGKRQGWLLPRKNQSGKTVIQLQVGYKGVEAIHQRMGVIDRLSIRVVYANDEFQWSGDDQEKPNHQANWLADETQRGAPEGAFAITYYPDGSINTTVAPISEIYEKHRNLSDSWKSYQAKLAKNEKPFPPPWVTHEKAMIEKTMAYIAAKQWPANIRDEGTASKILETLHEVDVADYSSRYTKEQKEAFDVIFKNDDALGMYLFRQYIDIESYVALFNTFPKGEKTKSKDKVRQMESKGHEIHEAILAGLKENDAAMVLENIEGCEEITLKLIKHGLDEHGKAAFKDMTEAA